MTFVAAVGGFLFGYDLSLISGAMIFLKAEWHLTPFWLGVVTGGAILGCPFGPLAGVWLADRFGRNKTLLLSAVLFIVSAIGVRTGVRDASISASGDSWAGSAWAWPPPCRPCTSRSWRRPGCAVAWSW